VTSADKKETDGVKKKNWCPVSLQPDGSFRVVITHPAVPLSSSRGHSGICTSQFGVSPTLLEHTCLYILCKPEDHD